MKRINIQIRADVEQSDGYVTIIRAIYIDGSGNVIIEPILDKCKIVMLYTDMVILPDKSTSIYEKQKGNKDPENGPSRQGHSHGVH